MVRKLKAKHLLFFLPAVLVFFFDQLTKYYASQFIDGSIPLIGDFLTLTIVQNTGSAFGLLQGLNTVFIVFSVLVIFGIFYYYKRLPKKSLVVVAVGLLLSLVMCYSLLLCVLLSCYVFFSLVMCSSPLYVFFSLVMCSSLLLSVLLSCCVVFSLVMCSSLLLWGLLCCYMFFSLVMCSSLLL